MNGILWQFAEWLKSNKWYVVENPDRKIKIVDSINRRYDLDEQYIELLKIFKRIISPDEKMCFLCCDEYNEESDLAFKWNEFERLSLESAQEDHEWQAEITEWWDSKFPIIISVKDGYSYYAIDMKENRGKVVKGEEPEFEQAEIIAESFYEFLELVIEGNITF